MKLSLRYRLWEYFEAAAIGILLAGPPMVLRSTLNTGNQISIVFPATILAWIIFMVIFTNTSWGARSVNVQVGLWGSSFLWLIFALLIPVNGLILVEYGIAGAIFAALWLFRGDEPRPEKNWINALLIAGPVILHWSLLFEPQQSTFHLVNCLWVTIASAVNLWGAGLLAWKLNLGKTARQTAWTLLASLTWLAPFLWLADRPEVALTLPWTGWLVAIVSTFVVIAFGNLFEKEISSKRVVRPRVFEFQFPRAQALFAGGNFAPAIHSLREAGWAWPEGSRRQEADSVGIKTMLAYSLEQTGRRREAVPIAKDISRRLIDDFSSGEMSFPQQIRLTLLLISNEQTSLLNHKESFPNLFDAIESKDAKMQSLARMVVLQGSEGASLFLLTGLDHERNTIREFAMQRLIKLDKLNAAVEHIKERIPKIEPKIILTILQAWYERVSPDQWTSLANGITNLGNPHGLDVLAKLRNSSAHREAVSQAWESLYPSLRHRLRFVIWSTIVEDAKQAAVLLLRLHPHFNRILSRVLRTGPFPEKCRAANLAARVAFLLPSEAPTDISKHLEFKEENETTIDVQLAGEPNDIQQLFIPMIQVTPGNPMLLFVNHEKYLLNIQVDPAAVLSSRLHFVVTTDDIPIRPSLHNTFDPSFANLSRTLEFQATPDGKHAFADRLTVKMYIQGRGQPLMEYEVFVCDPYVLDGLKARSKD